MEEISRYLPAPNSSYGARKLRKDNPVMLKKFHLKDRRKLVFLTANDIASHCHVSKKTAYRWMQKRKIPKGYLELLKIKALGTVPDFEDYTIRDGLITTRTGLTLASGDLDLYSTIVSALWHDNRYSYLFREKTSANEEAEQIDWIKKLETEPLAKTG